MTDTLECLVTPLPIQTRPPTREGWRLVVSRGVVAAIVAGGTAVAPGQPAMAQEDAEVEDFASDGGATLLERLVITGTRIAEGVFETLSGSSALSRDRLEIEAQGGSVAEIVRLIPGLTTQTSADDPGTAINIRGMQDFGRVNVMVDGARQNFQKSGHEANGTFYLDPEMLKSVDVTRGPAATVYGSGAIGGVVSFTTIDADDVLRDGADTGVRLKSTLSSNAPGYTVHGEAAARVGEAVDVVGAATWKSLGDYRSGDGTTVDAAQDLLSGLLKARIRPDEFQEITLSGMRYRNSFDNGTSVVRETTAINDTLSAGYRYTPDSDFWDLSAKVYYTGTSVEQLDVTGGVAGAEKSYRIGTVGFDVFNTSRFDTGPVSHEVTYGADLFQDRVRTFDPVGTSDDLTPSGDRLAYGAYLQDRIAYDDWLEVIGALRYDSYELSNDDLSTRGGRLSPKLTVGVTPHEAITVYASYAEGYRAPAVTETLVEGFHPPPVGNGAFFPNPDLRPEVARTYEAGVNLRFSDVITGGDSLQAKVGIFRNDVDDYIDQVFVMFPIPGGYQYQNIARARIEGVEIEANYDSGAFFAGLSGQVLKGVNRDTGGGLQKVPPYRVSATAGLRAFEERLTLGARLTVVGAKDDGTATGFVGEAYELVDLFARWNVNETVTADLALNNVFDRHYTQYLNGDPDPGFNARLSLSVRF